MKPFFAPKSWQRIAPNTIEAWLVSGDVGQQRLAEETLTELGDDKARAYLQRLLTQEAECKKRFVRFFSLTASVIFLLLFAFSWFFDKSEIAIIIFAFSIVANFAQLPLLQATSLFQRAIIEYALRRPDVSNLSLLLTSLTTTIDQKTYAQLREILPGLMEQITLDNQPLIPNEFLTKFVESLDAIAKQKTITYIPAELAFAKAHITLCGNIRHAPALSALQAIAARDAKTPQERELQALAARYVADWDVAATVAATVPDVAPVRVVLRG